MKKFIVSVILLLSPTSYAADCTSSLEQETVEETLEIKTNVPKHLQGAEVCIFYKSGPNLGYHCVPAEKFKVVPRKQQFIVAKTKQLSKLVCGSDKNRISIMAGNGPKEGLDRSKSGTTVTVESRVGAVGGVQYQRLLTDKISIGAQLQTNESALINIGLDF